MTDMDGVGVEALTTGGLMTALGAGFSHGLPRGPEPCRNGRHVDGDKSFLVHHTK